jgi:aminoglycoside/choline kinase family phosphotransferase
VLRELVPLPGGAGARRYWRARFADGTSAVLMHALPEDPAILPPALRAERERIPFVEVTAFLASHALPVPEIFAVDTRERWVLLEDLGDTHLLDLEKTERAARLDEAIELLARVRAILRSAALPFERAFDETWVRFELRTFAEHGLAAGTQRSRPSSTRSRARSPRSRVLCLR